MHAKLASLLAGVAMAGCAFSEAEPVGESAAALAPRIYVSLGDSYSSGVGTREYYDSGCQKSFHAYAFDVAEQGGYQLEHAACSGARIPDVRNDQLRALSSGTTLVTISIGGNDAGFANVVTECAKPWPWSCGGRIDESRSFITRELPRQLSDLYAEIRRRAPPR